MSSKFKRFVLLAALPLSTWACQCAQPVSIDEEQPQETESSLPQQPPPDDGAEPAAAERVLNPPTARPYDCVDEDGDHYGIGPNCFDADCDDGDPLLGSHGTRSCFTGPAGAAGVGVCQAGTQSCSGGVLGPCEGEVTPVAETCDGIDNDCDGAADDAVTRSCSDGSAGVGICAAGAQTCTDGEFGACVGAVEPQVERCDGLDNDCDGELDENTTRFTRQRNEQSTEVILRPVDVILVVDNSGSMTDEIVSIQNNISNNFADLLANSGIDYRVIFLSKHGSVSSAQSICIRSPLSGNGSCSEPVSSCPVNGERFFHYSVEIGTHDSLAQIVATYNTPDECGLAPNGWSGWLRPNAAKVFIELTDAGPSTGNPEQPNNETADTFEAKLFALTPALFGTAESRNYMFHTIAGLLENTPATEPWLPTDPLIRDRCNGNGGHVVDDGFEYQRLSVRTGGLRYPICEYQSFDSVFQTVATGIIERTQMACDFQLKQLPAGTSMNGVSLEWTSGDGATQTLARVADQASCTGDAFYTSGLTIALCPGACTLWQSDEESSLDVVFSCAP